MRLLKTILMGVVHSPPGIEYVEKRHLAIGGDAIGFRPHEHLWVDVVRFRELAEQSLRGTESLAALEEAAACQTDPFLAGFTLAATPDFDDWQFEQTESVCREAVQR